MMKTQLTCLALVVTACVVESEPGSSSSEQEPEAIFEESADAADDDEDPGDSGGVFVPPADMGPDPDACDPMNPSCDPGEKCSLVRDEGDSDWDGRCVPIADETVALGERCVPLDEPGHDNCEDGSICWDIMNGEGTCLAYCQGSLDTPICDDGYVCNWGKSLPAGLCTPVCDPLRTTDCPETCGCYWANLDFFCLPRTSNIATGEPCGFINDCAPLNLCASAEVVPDCEGSACCAAYCDLGAPECGPGTECSAFFEQGMAPPGYEHIGICILPGA